jgi:hypothetical protein
MPKAQIRACVLDNTLVRWLTHNPTNTQFRTVLILHWSPTNHTLKSANPAHAH